MTVMQGDREIREGTYQRIKRMEKGERYTYHVGRFIHSLEERALADGAKKAYDKGIATLYQKRLTAITDKGEFQYIAERI